MARDRVAKAQDLLDRFTDQGAPTEPRVRPLTDATDPTTLTESGRGLLTVATLATAWSWTGTPSSRTVHATFATPAS
jgi:hypothetical protein